MKIREAVEALAQAAEQGKGIDTRIKSVVAVGEAVEVQFASGSAVRFRITSIADGVQRFVAGRCRSCGAPIIENHSHCGRCAVHFD